MMGKLIAPLIVIFLVIGMPSGGLCESALSHGPPDKIYKEGEWELQIRYRNKGTRSEGQHGVLLRKGKIVEGGGKGQLLDTELGMMKYHGERAERPWYPTGWNFDSPKITHSWIADEKDK